MQRLPEPVHHRTVSLFVMLREEPPKTLEQKGVALRHAISTMIEKPLFSSSPETRPATRASDKRNPHKSGYSGKPANFVYTSTPYSWNPHRSSPPDREQSLMAEDFW